MIDNEGLDGTPGGLEAESELLLKGGEERCDARVGRRGRQVSAKLAFVRSPLEVEVVSAGQAGFVDDGAVEDGALQHGDEVSHGCVSRGHQNALWVNGADESRLLCCGSCARPQFRTAFGNFERVEGENLGLMMEGQLEPVGQEGAQHGHLLVVRGLGFTGGEGQDVVVIRFDPGWTTGNRLRIQVVGSSDEQLERVVLLHEPVETVHDNVARRFGSGLDRLDGSDFECGTGWGDLDGQTAGCEKRYRDKEEGLHESTAGATGPERKILMETELRTIFGAIFLNVFEGCA
jgi:hypothetical protein